MQGLSPFRLRQWLAIALCLLLALFAVSLSARTMDKAQHDFERRLMHADHHQHGWLSTAVSVPHDGRDTGHDDVHHYHPEGVSVAVLADAAPLAVPAIHAGLQPPRPQQPMLAGAPPGLERPPKTVLI